MAAMAAGSTTCGEGLLQRKARAGPAGAQRRSVQARGGLEERRVRPAEERPDELRAAPRRAPGVGGRAPPIDWSGA